MDSKSPQSISYLTRAKIECPEGQILQSVAFSHKDKKEFRFNYECIFVAAVIEYETITNGWSEHMVESPNQGNINLLDRQSLDCYSRGFLATIFLEINLETEQLRYVYRCGKFAHSEARTACQVRQTPKHDAENYLLTTLEHHDIKCQDEELLSWFQLKTDGKSPYSLLWYNYECCGPPISGIINLIEKLLLHC